MTQSLLISGGVTGQGDLAVTASSGMSLSVASGTVWIPGTLGNTGIVNTYPKNQGAQTSYGLTSNFTDQGCYFCYAEGTSTVTISAADPSNPRIDLVVASIQDSQYAGSNNQPLLQVVTGTPSPSPSAPSAPSSSVVLAQVAVAAGATSITSGNISDERPGVALGGRSAGNPVLSASGSLVPYSVAVGASVNASASIVAPEPGLYLVVAGVETLASTASLCGYNMNIDWNGSAFTAVYGASTSTSSRALVANGITRLSAGDEFTLFFGNSSGSGGSVTFAHGAPSATSWFEAIRVA